MLLNHINHPKDLKKLSRESLPALASEIRAEIIKTVGTNGGHLAPSLGVVDLTIAWHRVFNAPHDKIVWDVGHQVYAHKILTGRRDKFSTIRTAGGLSGFTTRKESAEYDPFGAGHAGTSISAALGMSAARDLSGGDYKVTALIGDGSLTSGEALEGLNNAGYLNKDLLIILNDNRMSIDENVGALSEYSKRIEDSPIYQVIRENYKELKRVIPADRVDLLKNLRASLLGLFSPGTVFTKLGFYYKGIVDGHDFNKLITAFEEMKNRPGAKILHIKTEKGHGYSFAQENATKFHGTSAFNTETGNADKKSDVKTYSQVFGETMVRLARDDKDIVAITAAMKSGTGLSMFADEFGDRFFDVGVAEQHAVTFAGGLSAMGKKPVVAIYSTFLQRAFDQVMHDIALQKLPVIFAIDRAGLVGDDGPTHHGVFDLSYLLLVPDLIVCAPKDENELTHLLYSAIKYRAPIAIRYPRGAGLGVKIDSDFKYIKIGEAEILNNGDDVLLVGIGAGVNLAQEAALKLKNKNINATVINARFLKPLDDIILNEARRIKKVITVEENAAIGGFGAYVAGCLAGDAGVIVKNIALPDCFIEHGNTGDLRAQNGFNVENIVKVATTLAKVRI